MSKARELANQLQNEINLYDKWLEGEHTKELVEMLVEAVLSEPETMKGWIEEGETPNRRFAHLLTDKVLHERKEGCQLYYYHSPTEELISFKESYDEVKQLIKEAS